MKEKNEQQQWEIVFVGGSYLVVDDSAINVIKENIDKGARTFQMFGNCWINLENIAYAQRIDE